MGLQAVFLWDFSFSCIGFLDCNMSLSLQLVVYCSFIGFDIFFSLSLSLSFFSQLLSRLLRIYSTHPGRSWVLFVLRSSSREVMVIIIKEMMLAFLLCACSS